MPGDSDRKRSILGTRVEVWAVKRLARRAALVIQDRFHGPIPARAGQPGGRWQAGWPTRAYPRSRGATKLDKLSPVYHSGLSPLARGNHKPIAAARYAWGPIPARAGQPRTHAAPTSTCGAYPRSRGATSCSYRFASWPGGLSPLARGNQHGIERRLCIIGPIPARAGQPPTHLAITCRSRAYPRSRGATWRRYVDTQRIGGLSPLARGNEFWVLLQPLADGPIPARAGQPTRRQPSWRHPWAYPRSRGATWMRAVMSRGT